MRVLNSSKSLPALNTSATAYDGWSEPGSFEFVSADLHHGLVTSGTSAWSASSPKLGEQKTFDSATDPGWGFKPKDSLISPNKSWRSWHAGDPVSKFSMRTGTSGSRRKFQVLERPSEELRRQHSSSSIQRGRAPEFPTEEFKWQQASSILQKNEIMLPCLVRPSQNITKLVSEAPTFRLGKTRAGARVHEVTNVEKKANQASALSRDRGAIKQMLIDSAEPVEDAKRRHQPVEQRLWDLLFAPIQNPRMNMPKICHDDPTTLLRPPRPQKPASPHFLLPEAADLVRVCNIYASLVRPHVPNGEDCGVPVLTRPAFCRMISSLRLSQGSKFVFHEAVNMFDALADNLLVKGCPQTNGSLRGIVLAARRGNGPVPPNELSVSDLFGNLLMSIADEVKGQREISEQFGFVKKCFFSDQLQTAELKATERGKMLLHNLAKGRGIMKLPETGAGKPRTPPEDPKLAAQKRRASNRRKSKLLEEEAPQEIIPKASDEELAQKLESKDALYAHTFAISKGEFLTSMLLEPEVLQFVWMFDNVFAKLFEIYSDVPTSFLGHQITNGGHMSYCAFMRFCIDFCMFPAVVDFCTLQSVYRTAENIVDLEREDLLRVLQKEKAAAIFKVDDVVELGPGAMTEKGSHGLKPGEPGRVLEIDTESEIQACRVVMRNGKKKWYKVEDLVHSSRSFNLDKQDITGFNARLEWLNKDFGDMTENEMRCVTLLSAMEDWMADRRLRVRDIFGMIDASGDGQLGADEILKGIQFMGLENPPDEAMVENVLVLIDEDASGEVDMAELDSVLMAIRERKARHRKADNFFLKITSEMSVVEIAAEEFFVPLVQKLDQKGWGAVDFFFHFDADGNNSLSVEELVDAGVSLGIEIRSVDMFKRCCLLVDPNIDGTIGVKELNRVIAMVREALQARDLDAQDSKNPFLALAPASFEGPKMVRIFGKKAFVECLLKIAFAYLTFHGSAIQAELPAHAKALWLLGYLSWQFRRHKAEHKVTSKLASQTELRNVMEGSGAAARREAKRIAESITEPMPVDDKAKSNAGGLGLPQKATLHPLVSNNNLGDGASKEIQKLQRQQSMEPQRSPRMADHAHWGKVGASARMSTAGGTVERTRGFSTVMKNFEAQGMRAKLPTITQEAEAEKSDDDDEEVSKGASKVQFPQVKDPSKQDVPPSQAPQKEQVQDDVPKPPKAKEEAVAEEKDKDKVRPVELAKPVKLTPAPEVQSNKEQASSLGGKKEEGGNGSRAGGELRKRKKASEKAADAKKIAGAARSGRLKLQAVVRDKKYAKYLSPLKRLIIQWPELFVSPPSAPPKGAEAKEKCLVCSMAPHQGWGNAFCSKCGQADEILWQCIGKAESNEPVMVAVLDRIIADFGTEPIHK